MSWRALWHVVVVLGLIFWMYDGYAWLTNAVPARGARRSALLLGGMACFLVLAIATPSAFARAGLTFGVAYLAVNAIHSFLYVRSAGGSSSLAMRALAPWNLAGAAAVLVSGAIGGLVQELLWTLVFVGFWFASRPDPGFEIGPAHFVERHGLLVLIAIGESVVATGIAAREHPVDAGFVAVAVVGLALSAGLWWTHFGGEAEERVERAFTAATGERRVRMAFYGFGYAHYAMLLGVVLVAVGLKQAVSDPGAELSVARALALAGGVAVFVAGDGAFRAVLGLRRAPGIRELGAVAVLLAVPVAALVSAAAGLAATTALLGAVLTLERAAPRSARGRPRPASAR